MDLSAACYQTWGLMTLCMGLATCACWNPAWVQNGDVPGEGLALEQQTSLRGWNLDCNATVSALTRGCSVTLPEETLSLSESQSMMDATGILNTRRLTAVVAKSWHNDTLGFGAPMVHRKPQHPSVEDVIVGLQKDSSGKHTSCEFKYLKTKGNPRPSSVAQLAYAAWLLSSKNSSESNHAAVTLSAVSTNVLCQL
ncbi:hypothetical protein BKA82DRAFT_4022327 [Pisolithus tinctorius]|nr:hypothetical protein BKA82DRAFT_4022327 [Pisolithus tinctorius]